MMIEEASLDIRRFHNPYFADDIRLSLVISNGEGTRGQTYHAGIPEHAIGHLNRMLSESSTPFSNKQELRKNVIDSLMKQVDDPGLVCSPYRPSPW